MIGTRLQKVPFASRLMQSLMLGLPILEQRLIDRWINHGFSTAEAKQKALGNDIPNAKRVIASRCLANRIIQYENQTL